MLSEQDKKAWDEIDELAQKYGGYVDYVPGRPRIVDADYRAMSKYCKEKGISSFDLTDEEYAMFAYDPPHIYGNVKFDDITVKYNLLPEDVKQAIRIIIDNALKQTVKY